MQVIQRGAEAILYIEEIGGNKVLVKERLPKGYRIPQLDDKIRIQRTRREECLLLRAKRAGVHVPNVIETSESKIVMEWIDGKKLKDTLNAMPKARRMSVYRMIGEATGRLHSAGIVHGDLTTSNMILTNGRLFIIDFGLGKISGKIEDQAVDLFLLYEALKSTHLKLLEEAWKNIINAYKQNYPKSNDVLKRIEKIERRRRYKGE
ncbi:MAG: KEOPS complex kinase/ATPase Bud32 [Candidatus Aenigmatarchaeota archaeon]